MILFLFIGYLYYSLLFSIIPIIVILLLLSYQQFLIYFTYGKPSTSLKDRLIYYCLLILRCIYMPTCLAVSRLYYCEKDGSLSADPSVKCWTGEHLIISILCLLFTFPLFVGLPIIFHQYVSESVIYNTEFDHEKRLQAWELSYIFKLSNYWEKSQLWILSSFRRKSAYLNVNILLFKAYTLLLFLLFRFSMTLQSFLFWFGTFISLIYILWFQPYRQQSTNVEISILIILLFVDTTFGLFNAFGVQNSVLVASTETVFLLCFNVAGLAILFCVFIVGFLGHSRWPTERTIYRLQNSSLWPTILKWMELIKESQALDLDCYICIPEAVDILGLENSIRNLRKAWFTASSVGSVYTVILRENIEQLLLTHTLFLPYALRRHEYLDKAWIDGGGEAFSRRNHTYKLANPTKRRIITKLLALKAFVGNRVVNREIENEDEYNYNNSNIRETDEYGMDMIKHRRLAALLLTDGKDPNALDIKPIQKSIQEIQAEKEARRLKELIWNSNEDYQRTKVILNDLSKRSEELLQKYKWRVQQILNGTLSTIYDENITSEHFSELFYKWNDVINKYNHHELEGGALFTGVDEEEWLTYRFTLREKWRDFEDRIEYEIRINDLEQGQRQRQTQGQEINISKENEDNEKNEEQRVNIEEDEFLLSPITNEIPFHDKELIQTKIIEENNEELNNDLNLYQNDIEDGLPSI